MKLVYLHGPPASGKYTIASCLEASVGARNLHNHLTLDVAEALFAFGSPEFWKLVRELRLTLIRAAAASDAAVVVVTSCYVHPDDAPWVEAVESIVTEQGGSMAPVHLSCSSEELERRVTAASRIEMRKLRSLEGLRRALEGARFSAIDRPSCITVETEGRTPEDCAREIVERLGLR